MQKPSRLFLLAPIAVAALAFSACSDDSGSSAATTAGGAGGTATTAAAPSDTSSTGATSTLDPIVGNVDLGVLAGCPFFTKEDAKGFLGADVGDVNMKGSQVDGETILAVCAYNDLSGVAENGVSVSAKLVPGSGANVQGDLLDLEQNRFAGQPLQTIDDLGDGARAAVFPGSDIKLVVVFTGPYELDVAAGPNKSLDEVVALARETIPKLPEPPNSD
jgi:hypothetical protein